MTTADQANHVLLMHAAESAVNHAQQVRAYHRKRTHPGHSQRKTDVRYAEMQIRAAMKPIRSAMGRIPYDKPSTAEDKRHAELRAMSKRVQSERRKLWKLRGGKPRRPRPESGA